MERTPEQLAQNLKEAIEKQTGELQKALIAGELAAVKALKAIVSDSKVDAGVRLSASHILLQARSELKRPNTATES